MFAVPFLVGRQTVPPISSATALAAAPRSCAIGPDRHNHELGAAAVSPVARKRRRSAFGGMRFHLPTNVDRLEYLIITGSVVMEPMVGQIELFAFSFAPVGFLPCNGALLPINENTVLFSLLGTTYGGDGTTTFGLPNLAPVTPQGPGYYIAIYGVAPPTQ
jgi:hypothetical protein